ncbi:conserved hypothetical protein [Theileria orientalis strain Shintoku]|uniref:Nitric oxide synthase-interacting protein zinc-finger domain-containing protein n=1 Tax=Theileria orientalis strain Shintoku TaxID=869250 RepID=J4DAY8_THEOR|nr:conserved hypothetical protein [Theileria orientalis strain Shintoku]PVC53892.1 hypothetical protein MACL_00003440 [Theileria orientalis]BAM42260.1 conserved hypothetical protein [Theileria orientalis strain Shintoku]|eukprot:XP_009692561.1 conserved hypothetical protein [Theileria orientalis strain Shintoku]
MTRHSKNNTANSIFTYHERKKVKDFNTLTQRLGASSMRKFEQCWLCLSTAVKPVTTPEGYIYCKECIIVSLSKQMEKNKKKLSQWELDMKAWKEQVDELKRQEESEKKRKLVEENLYSLESVKKPKVLETNNKLFKEDIKEKYTGNFWVSQPSKADAVNSSSRKVDIEELEKKAPVKPKSTLTCPISGKPLKLKDLVDINPEVSNESDAPNSEVVWLCSVSKKPILHNQACVYKKNGKLVMKQYIGTCDEEDAANDELFVRLIPAGTGFASHNNVEAKKFRPCMQ